MPFCLVKLVIEDRVNEMRQLKIVRKITNRDTHSLDKYLQEIGKIELIDAEAEVELAKGIKQGDSKALEKLVKANLRFVVSVAKQYQNQGVSLIDLINDGNVGLIKAAMRFDETRGFKFISYAVWWVRQSMMQAIGDQSRIVRLPLNRAGDLRKINHKWAELEQKMERDPSHDELAEVMEIPVEYINDTLRWNARNASVNAPLLAGEESTLLDVIEDESGEVPDATVMLSSLQTEIARSLSALTKRESEVLSRYFGLQGKSPLSLQEIGMKLELTTERVRQIKESGLRKLRKMTDNSRLRAYLG